MSVTINGTTGITSPAIDVTTPLAVADLGTGTPSASNFLRGDGSWQTPSAGLGGMQVFTSSGTFTVPAGVTKIKATIVGGGGGGGFGGASSQGGGGGSGGHVIGFFTVTPGATLSVSIGAGGSGGSSWGHSGSTGGNTTFNGMTANGGAGGGSNYYSGPNCVVGGAGGSHSGGTLGCIGRCGDMDGIGGFSLLGSGGRAFQSVQCTIPGSYHQGDSGVLGGGGGSGYWYGGERIYGGAGGSGVCLIEW